MEDQKLRSSLSKIPSHGGEWDGPYQLLFCSSKGDKTGVIHELKIGVDANLAYYDKRTALHSASCEGFTEIIDLLIDNGADVNSMDRWVAMHFLILLPLAMKTCKILEAHGGTDPVYYASAVYLPTKVVIVLEQ